MVGLSVSVNTEIKSVSDTVWKINHVCVILLYIPEYVCHVIKKKKQISVIRAVLNYVMEFICSFKGNGRRK